MENRAIQTFWLVVFYLLLFFRQSNLLSPYRSQESCLPAGSAHPSMGNRRICDRERIKSSKPVSILLTAPSDTEFHKPCDYSEQVLSDPSLMRTACVLSHGIVRRASDDTKFYCPRSNNLTVVNLTHNPFIQHREASDGLLALRADREQQRRHSICPTSSRSHVGSTKSIR